MRLDDESEAELREIALRLEQLVPGDTAHLTIPADADGKTSAGNRAGYLRFGLAFLRAALDPLPATDTEPARIVPELEGLLSRDSRAPFELCEIDESIVSRPPVSSGLGAPGQLASAVLVVALLLLCLIGASVVWRWFFG
jgi:hypothetical protein